MDMLNIPNEDIDSWISELKPYQQKPMKEFLNCLSIEEAAEKWVSSTGSVNIVQFGGTQNSKPFWNRFKDEFDRFLCDRSAYAEEKQEIAKHGNASKAIFISSISAAIGAKLGMAGTLLAPPVALLLCVAGKMSINAYCKNKS